MKNNSDLETKRKRDFDDLQNESAGRETGRIRRFLTNEAETPEAIRKKRARQAMRSLLDILLEDPIYRATYEKATKALIDAMSAVERALVNLAIRIDALEDRLEEMDTQAARLPDGTRVYRDANGVVRRAGGSVVEDTLAATILWTGTEPSYKEHLQAEETLGQLQAQQDGVTTYRDDVLGPAQDQMNDPDDPPSLEVLEQIIDSITGKMPEIVQQQQAAPHEDLRAQPDSSQINIPKIRG